MLVWTWPPAGTSVKFTIMEPGTGRTRDVTIVRARIQIENVTWAPLPRTDVAHVCVSAFSDGATRTLSEMLAEKQQEELRGLVLDLRGNPGGLLDEAVGVTSQFLEEGNVLLVEDAQGKITPVPVQSGGVAVDIPMVVLIDRGGRPVPPRSSPERCRTRSGPPWSGRPPSARVQSYRGFPSPMARCCCWRLRNG